MGEVASASRWRRTLLPGIGVAILGAMAATLWKHGAPMLAAVLALDPKAIVLATILALAHRIVNAAGWGLTLNAMGQPANCVASARVWLASEACRWLPGSLWSFGSRAFLAASRGVKSSIAAASLMLELGITVLAWVAVAALGVVELQVPSNLPVPSTWMTLSILVATIATGALVVAAMWGRLGRKPRSRLTALELLAKTRHHSRLLLATFLFYVAMGLFNGLILLVITRGASSGASAPALGVISANAVSWLVGFLALFAPGGLVVREACLSALLRAWMPVEQAVAVALAWRLVQILAEIAAFALVATTGLPSCVARSSQPREPVAGFQGALAE